MKVSRWITKKVSHVNHLIVGIAGEVNPSENERKGDGRGQQTTPENQLMHRPPQCRPLGNEGLRQQMRSDQRNHMSKTAKQAALSEQLPAALPIHASRWFSNP